MDKTWETKRKVHFFANIKRIAQLLMTKHGVLAQGSSGFCTIARGLVVNNPFHKWDSVAGIIY